MAESSQFWTTNGTGDGPSGGYTQAEWNDIYNKLFAPGQETVGGVLRGIGTNLAVTGSATPLSVGIGAAIVHGFFYENTTALSLAVTTPVVNTTGGHVILRVNWAAQTIRGFAIRNTDGNSAIPTLTQLAGTTWEIRLASFTITTGGVITLTDTRSYAQSALAPALLSVDDTMIRNRVLRMPRRQGGNATEWDIPGIVNYTPTFVQMQCGSVSWTGVAATFGSRSVDFPLAFSAKPLVIAVNMGLDYNINVVTQSFSTLDAKIAWKSIDGTTRTQVDIAWFAIGPVST